MKYLFSKLVLSIVFAVLFSVRVNAQAVACPTIDAGPDVNLTCGNNCTTLNATYINVGSTTSYSVSPIAYNPIAPFNAGAPIIIGIDDRWSALLPLPFPFCFFGTTYTNVVAGSNGILSFDPAAAGGFCTWALGTPIPTTTYGLGTYPAIMGPYEDTDPTYQGIIAWEVIDATPCRKFVLNFYHLPYFGDPNSVSTAWCPSALNLTSQIVLYETTNVIDIIIQNKDVCPLWNSGLAIEGIQNATGTVAYTVPGRNNTVFTTSNDAWRFTPNALPSMVSLLWLDPLGNPLGTGNSINVCPATTTTYTLNAHYSNCPGGTTVDVSDQVTVTPSGSLQTSINAVQNISCFGGNNGSASVNINIGSPPYVYSWTPSGGNGPTASNLTAGNYTASITDASGCLNILPVTITQPPLLTANSSPPTNVSCFNGSDGIASVTAGGGTPNYVYLWSPSGGNGATASNLAMGNYTVTVTDANGCTATAITTIAQPTVLTGVASTVTNVSCFFGNNGSATVNPGGGTGPYAYLWSPAGGNAITANGLSSGTYTVTVTDSHGCTVTSTTTITQPAVLTGVGSTLTNVSCFNGNDGSARVNPGGGTGPYGYAWSPSGGNGQTASNLTAGNYTVTVTDANGCTITSTVVIGQPTVLAAAGSTVTNVSCNGGTDGSATVAANGGTGPYAYAWSPSGGNAITANNLGAGTYTVTVTDAHGCTITSTAIIAQPTILAAAASMVTDVTCNGGTDGSATVAANGGTGPYAYVWSPTGGNAITANNLTAGTYTVTVTDAHGCTITSTAVIAEPTILAAGASMVTDVSCNGGTDGSATVAANGGTGPYAYAWSPSGGNAITANNLGAGTYTVTVTDAHGCTITSTAIIAEPTILAAGAFMVTDVSCNGNADGSATVAANGGTGPYAYAWSPSGGNAITANNLGAGTYTVTVTDAHGCTITSTAVITEPAILTAAGSTVTNVACFSGTDGSATVAVNGGTGPYAYIWSPSGGNAITAINIAMGTYTVTVTDANGCSQTSTATITEPPVLTANAVTLTNISCSNSSNGEATVTAGGGTGVYNYLWSPSGGNGTTASNLGGNTYTVTVTDGNGCTLTATTTVAQTNPITTSVPPPTNVSCNGGSDGQAIVNVGGGSGPGTYVYVWTPTGGNGATAAGLSIGDYTVTVTDANGCSEIAYATITEPALLTSSVASTVDVLCNGGNNGSIIITVGGGTGAYNYVWTPSGGNSDTANNLTANIYTVTVTDANSCTTTSTATINEPTILTANISGSIDELCNGGTNGQASVLAGGGTPNYSYLWSSGGTGAVENNLAAGNYTVTVTDANGCTQTTSVTINEPPILTSSITNSVDVLCFGGNNGQATVTPAGGTGNYTYSWVPSGGIGATENNLVAGTYTVIVADQNGCLTATSVVINEPPLLTSSIPVQTDILCNGGNNGSATVTVNGGAGVPTYSWNTVPVQTTATASNLTAGNYTVTVTDGNGCITTSSVTITEPPLLTSTIPIQTDILCNGGNNGSATVVVNGGAGVPVYSWNTVPVQTTVTATNLTAGNYTVTVTDGNGCITTASVTINEPSALAAAINSFTNLTCNGAGDGTASTVANGGTPGYAYLWSPSGGNGAAASNLAAGFYSVTVTDLNGCNVIDTVTITEPAALTLTVDGASTICQAQCATITANPGGGTSPYAYSWDNGATLVSQVVCPTSTTNYNVQVTDANGCIITQSVVITVNPPLNVTASATPQICAGASGTVSATGGGGNGGPYSYTWSNGQTSSSFSDNPSSTTIYTVTIDDGCSPPVQTTTTIIVNQVPVVNFTPLNAESCIPTSVDFTNDIIAGLPGSTYQWNFGDGTSYTGTDPTHVYTDPGQYSVSLTITSSAGCVNSATVVNLVTADAIPTADFSMQEEVIIEDPNGVPVTFANASSGSDAWQWDFGDNGSSIVFNPSHIYTDTGTYTIQLISTSPAGCRDTTYHVIRVEGVLEIFIPSAFTPNGDGVNDTFNAYGMYVKDFDMWILDRWGGKIYHSTSLNNPWNGTYFDDGTLCQNGVYVYKIKAHDYEGKLHEYVGRVSLVR